MKKKGFVLAVIAIFCVLTACGKKEVGLDLASKKPTTENSSVYEAPKPGSYDSTGTVIITKVSEINKSITFYDYELGKSFTLSYDGITRFADKYDTAMAVGQLKTGAMVDIKFLKSEKLLVSARENEEAFTISDVSDFTFNTATKVFKYKEDSYKITSETVLLDNSGKVTFNDLSAVDKVTITGMDTTIYSIKVDEGHGYLSFKNDSYFIGGFVEIGKDIEKISEKMLMTLPEGDYDVKITAKGANAVKKATIMPGKETVLDLADITIEEPKTGLIKFMVTPGDAAVAIDGKVVDHDNLLSYEYGLHQIVVSAKGYETLVRYFNVGEEKATLSIILDKTEDNDKDSEEEISKTDGFYVYVTSPSDVEVYVDNVYIGMSPVAFAKKSGTHSITLRKTGYVTRSFNILVENTAEDVRYSFDSLAIESNSQTNTLSSNDAEQ